MGEHSPKAIAAVPAGTRQDTLAAAASLAPEHSNCAAVHKELTAWLARGGPERHQYPIMDRLIQDLWQCGFTDDGVEAATLRSLFGPDFLSETVQGWGLSKPFGYAGDFVMIDKIYQRDISPLPAYWRWDEYFHAHAAPQAVRGRKDYFLHLLHELSAGGVRPLRVLNLGTGPGRDVLEWLEGHPSHDIHFTCVDLDPRANQYAALLLRGWEEQVDLVTGNALTLRLDRTFDLVWSAGLCDYLSDRLFGRLLRRAAQCTVPEGTIVLGNFSKQNPSRAYMELMGDWHLIHRDPVELMELGARAGLPRSALRIESEPLGVNLFLRAAQAGV